MKGTNKMQQEFWEGEITITEYTIGLPSIHSPLFFFLTDLDFVQYPSFHTPSWAQGN